jgi:hypothetical protein
MHTDADQATRELVHDAEHSVAPQHDRLAAEEVHAPKAVGGMADERQPRGTSAARRRTIVFHRDRQAAARQFIVYTADRCRALESC